MLFKRIDLPPVYIEVGEREEYKKNLAIAMTENDYNSLIRFYYYKICDAIMNLDISKSEIAANSQHKVKSLGTLH